MLFDLNSIAVPDLHFMPPPPRMRSVDLGCFSAGGGGNDSGRIQKRSVDDSAQNFTDRRHKRMIKNRQSAARSRDRKQESLHKSVGGGSAQFGRRERQAQVTASTAAIVCFRSCGSSNTKKELSSPNLICPILSMASPRWILSLLKRMSQFKAWLFIPTTLLRSTILTKSCPNLMQCVYVCVIFTVDWINLTSILECRPDNM
ncbi:unnamed protein product [Cuscuta epithymum]|uniref:BZIP domain-containing protein n=1 Tax=Cuscuta epithymum TaxID=186058 RepID=A0AAV0D0N0_9ASTE|nr:unnamed protein product [Cuscuta epithymum]